MVGTSIMVHGDIIRRRYIQYSRAQVTVGGDGDQLPGLVVPSLIQIIGVTPLVVYPVSQV